jgi:hypothetical protein
MTRQEFLKDAVVEAARGVLARFLVWDRTHQANGSLNDSIDAHEAMESAFQDLRDACHAERSARSGR